MADLLVEARAKQEVLRYVGTVVAEGDGVKLEVGLRRVPQAHPFAGIASGDNIVAFRTRRYDRQPLIVRGPGAGPEVTAAGVFADLLRLATYLGART
jgi:aspartokinase/homoserine dehydrogenase 1